MNVAEIADGLSERMREVFRWASPRPDGDVRVHPYRDAGRLVKLELVERRTWQTRHALRRERAAYFLTPLGLAVKAHLEASHDPS